MAYETYDKYIEALNAYQKSLESQLKIDKTVSATITDASKASDGIYYVKDETLVSYFAYCDNTTYKEGEQVLVNVPQGNYGNSKYIIGKKIKDTDTVDVKTSKISNFVTYETCAFSFGKINPEDKAILHTYQISANSNIDVWGVDEGSYGNELGANVTRWLKNNKLTELYVYFDLEISPKQGKVITKNSEVLRNSNSSNSLIQNYDAYGLELELKFNNYGEVKIFTFTASEFLGCLYNTRIFGPNISQFYKQGKVFSLKNLPLEELNTITVYWRNYWGDTALPVNISLRNGYIAFGADKNDIKNEDDIYIYTAEIFKDNKFYTSAIDGNEAQDKATFILDWLRYDAEQKKMIHLMTVPDSSYSINWYEYVPNSLPTENDDYSTQHWPSAATGANKLFAEYKTKFEQMMKAMDEVAFNTLSSVDAVHHAFDIQHKDSIPYPYCFNSRGLKQISDELGQAIFDLEKQGTYKFKAIAPESTEDRLAALKNFYFTQVTKYLDEYIENAELLDDTEHYTLSTLIKNRNQINKEHYRNIQYLLHEIPYFHFVKDLTADTGKVGAKAVILKDGRPYLSTVYTNEIILTNGATGGLSRSEFGNSLTLVPSDDSNGQYYLYGLNGSLRKIEDASKIRELRIYFEGKEVELEKIKNIEWTYPTENTMLEIAPKVLYNGLIDNRIYKFDTTTGEYIEIPKNGYFNEGQTISQDIQDGLVDSHEPTYYIKNIKNKYIPIAHIKPPEFFQSSNNTFSLYESNIINGVEVETLVTDFDQYFKMDAKYFISNYNADSGNILLYRIKNILDRTATENYISVRVQFTDGTVCTGGLNFVFDTLGTNGSPFNFYLIPEGGSAVLTLKTIIDEETNIESKVEGEPLKITAHLIDAKNKTDLTSQLTNNLSWNFINGEYVKEISKQDNLCTIQINTDANFANNQTLLKASSSYGGYQLEAYLPIAFRTDEKYARLNGTTDIYYDSASNLLFDSENFIPYDLKVYDEDRNLVSAKNISYAIDIKGGAWHNLFPHYSKIFSVNNQDGFNPIIKCYGESLQDDLGALFVASEYTDTIGENNIEKIKFELVRLDLENPFELSLTANYFLIKQELTSYINFELEKNSSEYKKINQLKQNYTDTISIDRIDANNILSTYQFIKFVIVSEDENTIKNSDFMSYMAIPENKEKIIIQVINLKNNNNQEVNIQNDKIIIRVSNSVDWLFKWRYEVWDTTSVEKNIQSLVMDSYYFEDPTNTNNIQCNHTIIAKANEQIVWSQPVCQIRNIYPSAIINNWDGKVDINGTDNAIKAPMFMAGTKNYNNTLTGVILGTPQGDVDSSMNYTGIYGLNNGILTYGFKSNGTAFIGTNTGGQIRFDGNSGIIESGNYKKSKWISGQEQDGAGMQIGLKDGTLDSYNFKLTSKNIILNSSNDNDDDRYLTVQHKYLSGGDQKYKELMVIGAKEAFIQSANYDKNDGAGLHFDLTTGEMFVGGSGFNFISKKVYWDKNKAMDFGSTILGTCFPAWFEVQNGYRAQDTRAVLRYSVRLDSIFTDAVRYALSYDPNESEQSFVVLDPNEAYTNIDMNYFRQIFFAYLYYFLNPWILNLNSIRLNQDKTDITSTYENKFCLRDDINSGSEDNEGYIPSTQSGVSQIEIILDNNNKFIAELIFKDNLNNIISYINNETIRKIDDSMDMAITRFMTRAMVKIDNPGNTIETLSVGGQGIYGTYETRSTDGESLSTDINISFNIGKQSYLPDLISNKISLLSAESTGRNNPTNDLMLYSSDDTKHGIICELGKKFCHTTPPDDDWPAIKNALYLSYSVFSTTVNSNNEENEDPVQDGGDETEPQQIPQSITLIPYYFYENKWLPVYFGIEASGEVTSAIKSAMDQILKEDTNYLSQHIDLTNYVQSSELNNYVQTSALDNYAQTSTLNNYVQTSALNNYVQTSTLNNYVQTSTLDNYATINNVNTLKEDLYTKLKTLQTTKVKNITNASTDTELLEALKELFIALKALDFELE